MRLDLGLTRRFVLLPTLLNPRFRSLIRANALVLGSLVAGVALSGFPHLRIAPVIALPVLVACLGTADSVRCMRTRWSWYHGGVILCIYMDLMVVAMLLFLLIYPYFL